MENFDISSDNYISVHCASLNARLENVCSDIESNGGKALLRGLYEGDRRVAAKLITTKYGKCWLLADSESELIAARGKPFLPRGLKGANSRVLKSLDLAECDEWDSAYAAYSGDGCGLSSLSTVRVSIYRTGDEFGADAERDI